MFSAFGGPIRVETSFFSKFFYAQGLYTRWVQCDFETRKILGETPSQSSTEPMLFQADRSQTFAGWYRQHREQFWRAQARECPDARFHLVQNRPFGPTRLSTKPNLGPPARGGQHTRNLQGIKAIHPYIYIYTQIYTHLRKSNTCLI